MVCLTFLLSDLWRCYSPYFFRKSKQKSSWLSNRFAFKGVRHDKGTLRVINRRAFYYE